MEASMILIELKEKKIEIILLQNISLSKFIIEASERIEDIFGKDIRLTLELFNNPDNPLFSSELHLLITSKLSAKVLLTRLEEFDEKFYIDHYHKFPNLLITLG